MKTTISSTLLLLLGGCAVTEPMTAAQAKQMEPPICTSQSQCTVMWQRSQIWLVKKSAWRLQIYNDTLMQTFGPTDHSTDVAYTITKEPLGGESYQIVMRAVCSNIFGCVPQSPRERIIEFNTYLRQSN